MKIRSICVGVDATWPLDRASVTAAGRFLARASERFTQSGIEVQTTRLALSPFAEAGPPDDASWVVPFAQQLEAACGEQQIAYISLGPVRWGVIGPASGARYASALGDALIATRQVSGSVEVASGGRLFGGAALAGGRIIARLARETAEGFGNFRFCTIAECRPNIPFFPSAYHAGDPMRFTIGLQAADEVRRAWAGPGSVAELESRLNETLGASIATVHQTAESLAAETGVAYGGTDLTPAPFPAHEDSAAGMLEDVGVGKFGAAGTLAAAAQFTAMLKRLPTGAVGYSGLMLPVLEDSLLAERASEGLVSVTELLLYSAVCGTGLDTVPLPGDASAEELAAVALDVASLAVALKKPLGCRLFPVPGKAAGEMTEYDFPYFANSRVLALKGVTSPRLFERLAP